MDGWMDVRCTGHVPAGRICSSVTCARWPWPSPSPGRVCMPCHHACTAPPPPFLWMEWNMLCLLQGPNGLRTLYCEPFFTYICMQGRRRAGVFVRTYLLHAGRGLCIRGRVPMQTMPCLLLLLLLRPEPDGRRRPSVSAHRSQQNSC
jgi:hypothetical protein